MASRTRPFLMTGAALASAAAIVAATPALVPTHDLAVGAPTPLKLSTAQVALTAISDITIQGINDAYYFGWGGYITDTNIYYPNFVTNNGGSGAYIAGASGVLYYLVDNALESFVPGFDLDNYYFEVGAPAVPYVAAGELFGTSSPIFTAAQSVFYYGVPNVINSIVVSATGLFPTFDIGPVKVGGGILASLFFYGSTPDYDPTTGTGFAYSTNGLSAILAYVSTSISDSLPSAAAVPSLAGAAAAIQTVVKDVEGAIKSATTPTASAAAKASSKTAAAEVKTEATDTTDTTTSTEGTSSTGGSSTDGTSSTEDSSTGTSSSTGVASSAKPATTTAPKTTKPAAKPQNPLNKIGKQISDALGITKKSKPSTSSDSSSSSDSGSSSSAGSAK